MTTATYKGYVVTQYENNHIRITKDGRRVAHIQGNEKKTSDELIDIIDTLIAIRESEG